MTERVRITIASGKVHVVGEPRDGIDVDGAVAAASDGDIVIRGVSNPITVRVPSGTDVFVGSASGNILLEGVLGAVSVTTASADVRASEVASIDARTVSGKLRVDVSHGSVRLRTKSAVVRVGRVEGEARIATVSGRIEIGEALGAVSAKSVSAAIDVSVTGREPVTAETVSGKIKVSLPDGVKPTVRHRSISGKRHLEVETGEDLVISTRSISGDLTVERA